MADRASPDVASPSPEAIPEALADAQPAAYVLHSGLVAAARGGDTGLINRLLAIGASAEGERGREVLLRAIESQSVEAVEAVVAAGAPLSHEPDFGVGFGSLIRSLSPLEAAMMVPDVERAAAILRVLARAGADVNQEVTRNQELDDHTIRSTRTSAVVDAARRRSLELMEVLVAAGADLNFGTDYTALYEASLAGWTEGVEWLCARGVDVNKAVFKGYQALMAASYGGHDAVVQTLLQAGADPNARREGGRTAIFAALSSGQEDVVGHLLAADADVNAEDAQGTTPLFVACEQGSLANVTALLERGADTNATALDDGSTPIFMATQENFPEIVKVLIDHNAVVNVQDKDAISPLYLAAFEGSLRVVEILLEAGANVNIAKPNAVVPLFVACQSGHIDVVRCLIAAGCDVNAAKDTGATPLYIAAEKGCRDIVAHLIEHGADPNIAKANGVGPLFIAAQRAYPEICTLLVDAGAALDTADIEGWTPTLTALDVGAWQIAIALLKSGASVNQVDRDYWAPLRYMVEVAAPVAAVESVLRLGADPRVWSVDNETALEAHLRKEVGGVLMVQRHEEVTDALQRWDPPCQIPPSALLYAAVDSYQADVLAAAPRAVSGGEDRRRAGAVQVMAALPPELRVYATMLTFAASGSADGGDGDTPADASDRADRAAMLFDDHVMALAACAEFVQAMTVGVMQGWDPRQADGSALSRRDRRTQAVLLFNLLVTASLSDPVGLGSMFAQRSAAAERRREYKEALVGVLEARVFVGLLEVDDLIDLYGGVDVVARIAAAKDRLDNLRKAAVAIPAAGNGGGGGAADE